MVFVDTDIMVDILREYPPAVAWLQSLADEQILVSGFVCAELIQGCSNKAEQNKVTTFLADYQVAWPVPECCENALRLFCDHFLSNGLGLIDALIAQSALELGAALHTFNTKHYQCVPGLQLVAPYEKSKT
jgi:predicted nucleic acid-binding protein